MELFTLEEARAELTRLRPVLDEIVTLRADAAELASAVGAIGAAAAPERADAGGPASRLGGLPEFKAAQARLDELMTQVQQTGADFKGLAPLLLDFRSSRGGEPVLLCWLEGETELGWYHRLDLGFAGRRPLP
jgi:hypothetical protein